MASWLARIQLTYCESTSRYCRLCTPFTQNSPSRSRSQSCAVYLGIFLFYCVFFVIFNLFIFFNALPTYALVNTNSGITTSNRVIGSCCQSHIINGREIAQNLCDNLRKEILEILKVMLRLWVM